MVGLSSCAVRQRPQFVRGRSAEIHFARTKIRGQNKYCIRGAGQVTCCNMLFQLALILCTASDGVTIGMSWWILRESRSSSPETMRSACPAMAVASTSSSSASRHTGCGKGGGSITSTSRCNSSSVWLRDVFERTRMASNFWRLITSANSD